MPRHGGARNPPRQEKPPLTHFLCLPLVTPSSKSKLETSLNQFRNVLCRNPKDQVNQDEALGNEMGEAEEIMLPSVHPKAIRPVGVLHCTLGVMSLNEDSLQEAVNLLEGLNVSALLRNASKSSTSKPETRPDNDQGHGDSSLERPISPPSMEKAITPLKIILKGLVSMHEPHKTSILYVSPSDPTDRLYPFCLAVQKAFKDNDLLVEDNRELKLHATIVNTIYVKGRKGPPGGNNKGQTSADDRSYGHGLNANAPLKIDATTILERFKEFVWAESVLLGRISICEMGAKKVVDAGGIVVREEYTEVASAKLPR